MATSPDNGKAVVVYTRPLSAPVQTVENARTMLLANAAAVAEHVAKVAGVSADLIISTGISAIALADPKLQPYLLACTGTSILKSVADAARYGMVIGGVMGQAYLIPFKNTCTLMVGFRGYEALAYRSGQVKGIQSGVVYEGDEYVVQIGLQPPIVHRPSMTASHDDKHIVAAYAIALLGGGEALAEHMNRQDLDHIRSKSRQAQQGAYVTDLAEMLRKAPIRRLCKHVNLSPSDRAILDEIASLEDSRNGAATPSGEANKRAGDVLAACQEVEPGAVERDPNTGEVVPPVTEEQGELL